MKTRGIFPSRPITRACTISPPDCVKSSARAVCRAACRGVLSAHDRRYHHQRNADPDVQHDLLLGLREAFPDRREFRHAEGNSTAHLKCSYVGPSQTVLIEDGKPILGIWQGVYFCEFDGPRHRRYYIKVMADN